MADWSDSGYVKESRRVFSRMGLALAVLILIQLAVRVVIVLAARQFTVLSQNETVHWLLFTLPAYLLAFPGALLIIRTLPAPPPEKPRHLPPRLFVRAWMICFSGLYLSNLVTMFIVGLLQKAAVKDFINPVLIMAEWPPWLVVLVGCVLAPAAEELLFRRELLRRLKPYGEKFAVLSSALLFALVHGNLFQLLYAFAAGVIFAYVALRTGSILQSFLLHAMFNGLSAAMYPLMSQADVLEQYFLTGAYVILIVLGLFEFSFFRNDPVLPHPEKETAIGKKWGAFLLNPGMAIFILLIGYIFFRSLSQ